MGAAQDGSFHSFHMNKGAGADALVKLGVDAIGRHNADSERDQGDRDDLETGESERDSDNRQAEQDASDQMPEGQPPAEEDDPDHVPDYRGNAGFGTPVDRPAERPEHITGDPEGRDPERDGDDQDECHQPGQDVGDDHPESFEDQPYYVQYHPKHGFPLLASLTTFHHRFSSADSLRPG